MFASLSRSSSSSLHRSASSLRPTLARAFGAAATPPSGDRGGIGKDGKHEIWREGIYDHDNEPK